MNTSYIRCPLCSCVVPMEANFCIKCGFNQKTQVMPDATASMPASVPTTQQGVQGQVVPVPASVPPSPIACAACQNENVQKVTAIYQSGTWSSSSSGTSVSAAFVGHGNVIPIVGNTATSTAGTSNIARLLAPPVHPVKPDLITPILGAILVAVFIFIFSFGGLQLIIFTGLLIAIELVIVFRIVSAMQKLQNIPVEIEKWNEAMHHWDQLFYCPRCDQVYNPQTRKIAPSRSMYTLL